MAPNTSEISLMSLSVKCSLCDTSLLEEEHLEGFYSFRGRIQHFVTVVFRSDFETASRHFISEVVIFETSELRDLVGFRNGRSSFFYVFIVAEKLIFATSSRSESMRTVFRGLFFELVLSLREA